MIEINRDLFEKSLADWLVQIPTRACVKKFSWNFPQLFQDSIRRAIPHLDLRGHFVPHLEMLSVLHLNIFAVESYNSGDLATYCAQFG
jgi:hypothetical protein